MRSEHDGIIHNGKYELANKFRFDEEYNSKLAKENYDRIKNALAFKNQTAKMEAKCAVINLEEKNARLGVFILK